MPNYVHITGAQAVQRIDISPVQMANLRAMAMSDKLVTQYAPKTAQLGGVKIVPQVKETRYMPRWINQQGVAAGASYEINLGTVHDIVDINQTALAAGQFTLVTPDGDLVDLFGLTRIKADQPQHYELPAGKYVFTNITAGALNLELLIHTADAEDL